MIGRLRGAAVVQALLLAVGATACGFDSCADDVADAEAEVHTDHRWTEEDVPGIGQYVEVHWQTRARGNPCSRAPGPTDWHYQGVARMRADEAQALLKAYEWTATSPAKMWPALQSLVPADAQWLHSEGYAKAHDTPASGSEIYLSPDNALVYFTLRDS
ncbi:hypothetical protein [Micromonospora sp. CPCC 206061]|uniref:hypothetical protein n=1 Tax=Micromonospora sp. CPCC 206061 TaxID=3122410 RepID=UPI002FF3EC53